MNSSTETIQKLADLLASTAEVLREIAAEGAQQVANAEPNKKYPDTIVSKEDVHVVPDKLAPRQAAEFLAVTTQTLEKWRSNAREGSPPYTKGVVASSTRGPRSRSG